MNGFCAHCGKRIGFVVITDYDTDKVYCGRECFNQRSRRRPHEYPIHVDDNKQEELLLKTDPQKP